MILKEKRQISYIDTDELIYFSTPDTNPEFFEMEPGLVCVVIRAYTNGEWEALYLTGR